MVQNIPKALVVLVTFIAKMVRGLDLFEVALGITHNTKTAVQADLDATNKAQNEAQAAQQDRIAAAATRDAEDEKVSTFLTIGREVLKPKLGTRYSVAWREVGFVNNKLALERTMSGRVGQLRALQIYLAAHPELEAPGFVTADLAGALHTSAVAAMSDLDIALTTQRQKTAVRNAASAQLLKRARGLFQELKLLIPANDPRWKEFGYNVPADISVPSAPEGLTVAPGAAGLYAASWKHTVYADRYNLFQQVVGVDAEPVKIDTLTKTAKELIELPSGAHVKFYLTAVNEAGESVPSETVEVVVP